MQRFIEFSDARSSGYLINSIELKSLTPVTPVQIDGQTVGRINGTIL